jgi:hypothetical protein
MVAFPIRPLAAGTAGVLREHAALDAKVELQSKAISATVLETSHESNLSRLIPEGEHVGTNEEKDR